MTMKRRVIAILLVAAMVGVVPTGFAYADTSLRASIEREISALLAQVKLLQLQILALQPGNTQSTSVSPSSERLPTAIQVSGAPIYNTFSIAEKVHESVNAAREEEGLRHVKWNETLALVARLHSEDQAEDNELIADASKPCTYPLLRHEGKTHGLGVLQRTQALISGFRAVGENIVTFPVSKNGTYSYKRSDGPVKCPTV